MARIPIHRVGGAVDTTDLTAGPGDVLTPEIFIGSGSDENQQGTVPLRGSPALTLPVNGSQTLQAGYYTGGTVSQSIPTMGAQSIGPGSQMITIPTAGKYMTGNITIKTTKNLVPSVIKKGVTVGGVTGTFEGYVITDPKTLYKYGTFNGIQTITSFRYQLNDLLGTTTLERDRIRIYRSSGARSVTVVFDVALDLTGLNQIRVRIENSQSVNNGISLYRNHVTNYIWDDSNSSSLVKNPALGAQVASMNASGTGGDYILNVSAYTGNAYLYLHFFEGGPITSNIYLVQCE